MQQAAKAGPLEGLHGPPLERRRQVGAVGKARGARAMVHGNAQGSVRLYAQTITRTRQPVVVESEEDREPARRGRREEAAREVEHMLRMQAIRAEIADELVENPVDRRIAIRRLQSPFRMRIDDLDHIQEPDLSAANGVGNGGEVVDGGDHGHRVA